MPATSGPAALRTARTYPGTPDQIRVVRVDIRALADGCPLVDDIVLCASELTTNAVMHSHSGMSGGTCTVRVEIHPSGYAWVEVEDAGGPWNRPETDPSRSHGLEIVSKIASEWGIAGDYRGRTVWARFDWSSRTTDAASEPAATTTGVPRPPAGRIIGARPLPPWTTILDGRRLREMRHRHGLSQEQLATQAQISTTTIVRLERHARSACRTWTLGRLAAALGEHHTAIGAARASDRPRAVN
jgi:anti-sigma regulatory factor (Ser/Thr protein kinase)/DNA-binding XRE family transcriptional regulator